MFIRNVFLFLIYEALYITNTDSLYFQVYAARPVCFNTELDYQLFLIFYYYVALCSYFNLVYRYCSDCVHSQSKFYSQIKVHHLVVIDSNHIKSFFNIVFSLSMSIKKLCNIFTNTS